MATSESPDTTLCPDWIYSEASNVHIANHNAWYTTYHPFPSHLTSLYSLNPALHVLGIGTVTLSVRSHPDSFTSYGTSTITLTNVLHVPDYICNILGRPFENTYQLNLNDAPGNSALVLGGVQIAYFTAVAKGLFGLAVLAPEGTGFAPSVFVRDAMWTLSAHWAWEERVRWQETERMWCGANRPVLEPPYTVREMEFVNGRWGSEFRFLDENRLSVCVEGKRSEGRRIVRELLKGGR